MNRLSEAPGQTDRPVYACCRLRRVQRAAAAGVIVLGTRGLAEQRHHWAEHAQISAGVT